MVEAGSAEKRRRVRRTEAQWRELVARFEASGQSQAAFCAEQGVVASSFARWCQRLRRAACRQSAVVADSVFVELAPERDGMGHWDVELELGAGVVLRLMRPTC